MWILKLLCSPDHIPVKDTRFRRPDCDFACNKEDPGRMMGPGYEHGLCHSTKWQKWLKWISRSRPTACDLCRCPPEPFIQVVRLSGRSSSFTLGRYVYHDLRASARSEIKSDNPETHSISIATKNAVAIWTQTFTSSSSTRRSQSLHQSVDLLSSYRWGLSFAGSPSRVQSVRFPLPHFLSCSASGPS